MLFVGVDLHKHTITMVVVDASRKSVSRKRFSNLQTDQMTTFLKSFGPIRLTVEATASYAWFVELVEPTVERVILAHPGKLRIIAQSTRKSDNLDARALAEMLALDQIPASYRPTPRQREHRLYVRHRQYLQRKITGVRNKIRRILSNHNLDRPDLFTVEGRKYLKSLQLPMADRFCIDHLMFQWTDYRMHHHHVNLQLKEFATTGPDLEQEDRALLRSIPGIGVVSVEVILAELADWRRFSSLKKVTSYAGMAPGQRESAGKRKALHIEKTGSPLLRWVLVQAAWQLVKRSERWRAIYERLKGRIGVKKAIIAVARRLLGVCYSVLKSRRPYTEATVAAPLPPKTRSAPRTRSIV
jgi:transposase